MRRLLVPAAFLLAIVALLAVRPLWSEHAPPKRAARAPLEQVVPGNDTEDAQPGSSVAAPSEEAALAEAQARVHGVVMARAGGLWLARVVAYRRDSEGVIAESYTNPEGAYALAIDGSLDFELAVEPAAGTFLVAMRRRVILNAGDDREEDFALTPMAMIVGKLVDKDGNARDGIGILAVRPGDMSPDESAHPNTVLGREVGHCRSGADGTFRLSTPVAGTYALVIGDPQWTLDAPAAIATDGPAAKLTVVPAISVDLLVKDIETGERVDAFSVRASIVEHEPGGRVKERRLLLEDKGSGGVFSKRVRVESIPSFPLFLDLEVTASGYLPWGPIIAWPGLRQTSWLLPPRERNTTIRVSFDDGQPYRGDIVVTFFAPGRDPAPPGLAEVASGSGSIPFSRVEDGVFRGGMPRGRWTLVISPSAAPFLRDVRLDAGVEVTDHGDAEASLVLPAGGTILLSPPPGGASRVTIRSAAETVRNAGGITIEVPAEGKRIEGVPPGVYQVGYPKWTATVRGNVTVQDFHATWFRDVRVVVGSTEEVLLPTR